MEDSNQHEEPGVTSSKRVGDKITKEVSQAMHLTGKTTHFARNEECLARKENTPRGTTTRG